MHIEERIQQSVLWEILLKFQRIILVFVTCVAIGVLGGAVTSRYVFHCDFRGYDEIVLVVAFWMYFIGSSHASFEESHVAVDIVEQNFSRKTALKVGIFSKLLQIFIGIPLIYLSYEMLVWDIQFNPRTADWSIPFFIPQVSMLIGFALMTFYSLIYILRDYHKLTDEEY